MATPLLALLCCALARAEPPEVGCSDADAEAQSMPVSLVQKGWTLGRPTALAVRRAGVAEDAGQPGVVQANLEATTWHGSEAEQAATEHPVSGLTEAPTEATAELPMEPTEAPTEAPEPEPVMYAPTEAPEPTLETDSPTEAPEPEPVTKALTEATAWHESKAGDSEVMSNDPPCPLHAIWNVITVPFRVVWNAITNAFHGLFGFSKATPGALSLLSVREPSDVWQGMFVVCVMGTGFVGAVCFLVYFLSPCWKNLMLELEEPYRDDQYYEPVLKPAAVLTTKRVTGNQPQSAQPAPLQTLGRELKTQHGSLPASGISAVGAARSERSLAACEPAFDPMTAGYFQPAPSTSPHLGGAGAALMRAGQRPVIPSSETRLLPPRVLQAERRG